MTARAEAGKRHDELYPAYRVPLVLEEFDPDAIAERADAALVAYPHKAAAPADKALRERGLKVVDLSADYRLDRESYERWYQPHEAPELLDEAVYGLPEAHRDEIREASLVAAPGCNSTAALLALLPLRGRMEDAVVDIKTGVSGAGREATEETHFVSAIDNVNPYKTEGHRHVAELEQELPGVRFAFVPHLLPIDQGLLASCYVTPTDPTHARGGARAVRAGVRRRAVRGGDRRAAAHPGRALHQPGDRLRDRGRRPRALASARSTTSGRAPPGQAVQDLNLMLGSARDGGAPVSASAPATFFRSRWVERPAHVTRARARRRFRRGSARRAWRRGIKPEGLDVGVLVSDAEETVSAARFTTNARVGAPVMVSREAELDRLRAVAANSGGSNAGDGRRGYETALAMQAAAAEALGVEHGRVGLASTGMIGTELPREQDRGRGRRGVRAARCRRRRLLRGDPHE